MTELITPAPRSVISSPDTQAAIWFLGVLSQVRVSGEQTGGAFSLAESLARRATPARSMSTTATTRPSSCSTVNCG